MESARYAAVVARPSGTSLADPQGSLEIVSDAPSCVDLDGAFGAIRRDGQGRWDVEGRKGRVMPTEILTRSDEKVREAVVFQLDWEPEVDASHVGVSVEEGIVALTGYVDSIRTGGAGALTVFHGAKSRLVLPVIPERCQLGAPAADGIAMPSCGAGIGF